MGYIDDIEEKTLENDFFRKVLYTGKYMQLVVMCLKPGDDIAGNHPRLLSMNAIWKFMDSQAKSS